MPNYVYNVVYRGKRGGVIWEMEPQSFPGSAQDFAREKLLTWMTDNSGAYWRMWRDSTEFSQRFLAEIEPDGHRIRGRWEKSLDRGKTWQHDFNLDYIRVAPA